MCYAGRFLPAPFWSRPTGLLLLGLAVTLTAVGADNFVGVVGSSTNALSGAISAPTTPSLLGPLVRMAGAFALVLGLLFGAQWWLRNQRTTGRGRLGQLNVLEMKSLGQRQALYVIGYDQQRLLIATSPAGVSLLTTLPESTKTTDTPPVPVVSFADALMQVVGRR